MIISCMEQSRTKIVSFREVAARAGIVSAAALQASQELAWDEDGVIPAARLAQCVCAGESVGGQSLLELLLAKNRAAGGYAALVDAAGAFDLDSLSPGLETQLLWVRCAQATQAMKALDLLLRDDNFTLVLADLRQAGGSWRGVSSRQWYRLQRICHHREGRCLVFARESLSPSMDLTLTLDQPHGADVLDAERPEILASLETRLATQRQTAPSAVSAAG